MVVNPDLYIAKHVTFYENFFPDHGTTNNAFMF